MQTNKLTRNFQEDYRERNATGKRYDVIYLVADMLLEKNISRLAVTAASNLIL